MTDSNEIPLGDVTPIGTPAPDTPSIPNDRAIDQDEMTLALNYANKMGKAGISTADREKFLGNLMASKAPGVLPNKAATPQEIPLNAVIPYKPDFSDVKSGASTQVRTPTFLEQANDALRSAMEGSIYNPLKPQYKTAGQDLLNIGGEAVSYAKNFSAEHETVEPGPVTPEEMKQAKIMGIPTSPLNADEGGFVWRKDPNTGQLVAYHPTTYKMGTEARQTLDDATLKGMGLDPAAERARAANFAKNPFDSNADPIANITVNNSIGGWIQDQLNPHMAATRQYEALQQAMEAQKVVHYPQFHSEPEVAAAMNLLDNYKENVGKGVVEKTQDLLDEIKADPTTKLAQFAVALEADPEIWKIGKLRLGTLLNEAKIASLTADFQKATQSAELARRIQGIDKTGIDALSEGRASFIAQEEGKATALAGDIGKAKKAEILGNIVSEPIIGGAANVALDRAAQIREHGYVTEGSETAPFVQGAALGAVAAGGEALRLIPRKGEVPVDKVTPVTPPPGGGTTAGESPGTFRPGNYTGPGAPLSPETPINKGNRVPLAAGVDASGKVVHVDENMPDTLPMKNTQGATVTVPVTKMVAYHESVEFPLMHLTGPMNQAGLVDLLNRIKGEGILPSGVLAKLKKGISLSYDEAHDIATMAENQRVRALYGVHPDTYAAALQPYIKQAEKPTVTPTPPNLDTKPYTEAGKKALGVAAVAGGGAAIGAALSPDDREEGAKFGTFLPLLSRVFDHGGKIGDQSLRTQIRGERLEGKIGSPRQKAIADQLNARVQEGMNPSEIWRKYGYFQDAHDNWLREISDEGLTFKPKEEVDAYRKAYKKAPEDAIMLKALINHPELEKEYPVLWHDLAIKFDSDLNPMDASYDPTGRMITASPKVPRDVLVHEIQHAVQEYEGLPQGSSPKSILTDLKEERQTAQMHQRMLMDAIDRYKNQGKDPPKDLQNKFLAAVDHVRKFPLDDKGMEVLAFAKYKHVMGEVLAYTSEARTDFTPKMRETMYPGNQIASLRSQWDRAASGEIMKHEGMTKKELEAAQKEAADRERLTPKESTDLPHEKEHLMLAEDGNQRSIGALYNHYMPRLVRVMNRFMRVAGPRLGLDGEDIAQRAFYKAIQSLPDFKGGSSFYTWLYAIAKNTSLNEILKAMKTEVPTESMFKAGEGAKGPGALTGKVGFGGDETGSDPVKASVQAAATTDVTPEMTAAQRQISSLVQQAIKTLPEKVANVLRARQIDGLTDVETARALDMPVGTVRSYNIRGQQMLAQIFKGSEVERQFKAAAGIKKQGGSIDPDMLKRLAKFAVLAGGGATLGANYFDPQHPYKAMVQGAALALASGQIKWKNVYGAFKKGLRSEPDLPWKEQLNQYDHDLARGDRLTATTRYVIDSLVKTPESRVKISQHLDGNTAQLTPKEQHAADLVNDLRGHIRDDAINSGVLPNFLESWIRQTWKPSGELDQELADLHTAFKRKPGQPTLTSAEQRALFDKFTNITDGKARGLEPVSEDINVVIGNHVDSVTRAKANDSLISSLKSMRLDPAKRGTLIMSAGKAPNSYVTLQANQLSRYRVHPSLAPSLEYIYHNKGGGAGVLAVESANTAVKRLQVDLSLFHAKSLLDAFLGAGEFGHPWRNFVDAATSIAGKGRGHEEYLKGEVGDDIDHLIRSLKITPRRGNIPVEDVTSGFYEGLKAIQNTMDEAIPGSGKQTAGRIIQVSKALDHFLWENVHSGLKLVVAMNALERLRRSYAKEFDKNPNAHIPSTAELADMAGSYTNDTFGGVNWRRLADDARTQWGREFALAVSNPAGRRISQVMMFAPDWTYSTVRSAVKAINGGSGFGGLLNPKTVADLHRLYWLRSAFIYATLYNGINFAMSGHMIWDNKRNGKPEPFLVDLGNGEWAQANKHAMEVPNLVKDAVENHGIPSKWLLGKLGNLPSEAAEQLLGKEYLNPDYMPPMKGSGLSHALKRVLPFSAQSYLNQGPKEAISSALGVPIYGHEKAETWDSIQEKKQEGRDKARERSDARKQKRIDQMLKGVE